MSVYTIGLACFLYFLTAIDCYRQKDYPHSMMWFSYFLANVSLVWYEWSKIK